MTHPFHPLLGRQFGVVTLRHNWGEDRVYYHDEEGFATPPAPLEDSVASTRADRYEDLRRHALGGAPVAGGGLGLALFLRKGLAAWMEAWRCCGPRDQLDAACAFLTDLGVEVEPIEKNVVEL